MGRVAWMRTLSVPGCPEAHANPPFPALHCCVEREMPLVTRQRARLSSTKQGTFWVKTKAKAKIKTEGDSIQFHGFNYNFSLQVMGCYHFSSLNSSEVYVRFKQKRGGVHTCHKCYMQSSSNALLCFWFWAVALTPPTSTHGSAIQNSGLTYVLNVSTQTLESEMHWYLANLGSNNNAVRKA